MPVLPLRCPSWSAGDLPRKSQKRRRGQIDGRLDVGERLHVVLIYGTVAVELREDVNPVWRASQHAAQRTLGGKRVRTFDGRAGQNRRVTIGRSNQVRHLVLHAKRERRAIADDQGGSPGIGAEDICQPSIGVDGIGGGAGEIVVFVRHHGEAAAVRRCIVDVPGETEAEWILSSLSYGLIQLFLQFGQECRLGGCESRWISRET